MPPWSPLTTGRGLTEFDPRGRFVARRAFILAGRSRRAGEEISIREVGERVMRRLHGTRFVICHPPADPAAPMPELPRSRPRGNLRLPAPAPRVVRDDPETGEPPPVGAMAAAIEAARRAAGLTLKAAPEEARTDRVAVRLIGGGVAALEADEAQGAQDPQAAAAETGGEPSAPQEGVADTAEASREDAPEAAPPATTEPPADEAAQPKRRGRPRKSAAPPAGD